VTRAGRGRGAPEFGFEDGDSLGPAAHGAAVPAAGDEFASGGGREPAETAEPAGARPAAGGEFGP
jgi:hypothetical protein